MLSTLTASPAWRRSRRINAGRVRPARALRGRRSTLRSPFDREAGSCSTIRSTGAPTRRCGSSSRSPKRGTCAAGSGSYVRRAHQRHREPSGAAHGVAREAAASRRSRRHAGREAFARRCGVQRRLRGGALKGASGRTITDVVNRHRGSDLGPALAVEALAPYAPGAPPCTSCRTSTARIVSILDRLDPDTTLAIVVLQDLFHAGD